MMSGSSEISPAGDNRVLIAVYAATDEPAEMLSRAVASPLGTSEQNLLEFRFVAGTGHLKDKVVRRLRRVVGRAAAAGAVDSGEIVGVYELWADRAFVAAVLDIPGAPRLGALLEDALPNAVLSPGKLPKEFRRYFGVRDFSGTSALDSEGGLFMHFVRLHLDGQLRNGVVAFIAEVDLSPAAGDGSWTDSPVFASSHRRPESDGRPSAARFRIIFRLAQHKPGKSVKFDVDLSVADPGPGAAGSTLSTIKPHWPAIGTLHASNLNRLGSADGVPVELLAALSGGLPPGLAGILGRR